MIAQVVFDLPLEGPFDYLIPSALENRVSPGMRVEVLLGTKKRVGLVTGLIDKSTFENLKPLKSLIDQKPLLDKFQMALGPQMSAHLGCSLGEALFSIARVCEIQKLSKVVIKKTSSALVLHFSPGGNYEDILVSLIKPLAAKGQRTLILVADQFIALSMIEILKKHFSKEDCLVGTRSSVFRSLMDIAKIIMIDEEKASFKQEQTPRYETRDILLMRAKIENIDIDFISATPSVELMHLAYQGQVLLKEYPAKSLVKTQMVDLNNYKVPSRWFLSPAVLSSLRSNLSKGLTSIVIVNHHLGVEELQKDLRKQFSQAKILAFKRTQKDLKPYDILIGTSVLLRFKYQIKPQAVIFLDSDGELNRMDMRSCFRTWSMIGHFRSMAQGQLLIQSRQKDHYVMRSLVENKADIFYQEDMRIRRELGFSPFGHQISVYLRGKAEKSVEDMACALYAMFIQSKPKGVEVNKPSLEGVSQRKGQHRLNILLQGTDLIDMISFIKQTLAQSKRRGKVIITINVDP